MTTFGLFCPMDYYPEHGERADPGAYQAIIEQIKLADALDYDTFWIAESHFASVNGICPSPAVFLAHAFAQTRQIRMGPAVCVLPLHHPLHVAEDYALLDVLSGGRLLMGCGSGFLEESFKGFQIPIEEKHARFSEALAIIRRAWSGQRFSYAGRYYTVNETQLNVIPHDGAEKALWVSVTRPEAAAELAQAGYSLIVSPSIGRMTSEVFAEMVRNVAQARLATVVHVHVGRDMAEAERVGMAALERRMQYLVTTNSLGGSLRVAMRTMQMARNQGFIVFGDAASVRDQLLPLRQQGVENLVLFMHFGGMPQEDVLGSMRRFAEQVMPYLR